MKKHNFSAGPSILPRVAVENAAKAVLDLNGIGLSVLEISHRTKDFEEVLDEAVALFKELLRIPEGYSVLFLGGGASMQFCMVPFNLLEKKAGYINTGVWAKKALKEAKLFGEVETVASSEDKNFSYIPKGYAIPTDLDYLHITTNNTIFGTEYKTDIDSPVTLVADMSSDILSRPVDVSKYGLIYGGAQKNLGPAGVTFVIVRNDILGKVSRAIPTMLDYRTHVEGGSMFNTPPVFPIYVVRETLKWLKSIGGVPAVQKLNEEKAALLYNEIDRNSMFTGTAAVEDRSLMNVCFVYSEAHKELEPSAFLDFAKARGMVGIKGHRLVGGFRASIYNAMPKESVQALVNCMQEFEKQYN
ncbi:3-phosphoserine/phosphohydroxythreonine transaminase [uncultured Rikenella sp.]|uniref:3-phosphoserine/phosphohydroxythreonine transaminase n=1 Tax=uncultured Rikenella sp. TaxID=368003 RepID=UPI0025FBED51|nr:3-phosphoserine/phosphohydroxythreonine transaminase [uncultured Rikenella sp.]